MNTTIIITTVLLLLPVLILLLLLLGFRLIFPLAWPHSGARLRLQALFWRPLFHLAEREPGTASEGVGSGASMRFRAWGLGLRV